MYKSVGNNDVKRAAKLIAARAHNTVMQYDLAWGQYRRLLTELEALIAEYAERRGNMSDEDIEGTSQGDK